MSERYQREIEEILSQVEDSARHESGEPRRPSRWSPLMARLGQPWARVRDSISPGRVMLGAFVLLLVALLFRSQMPGMASPIAWAAVVLFIVGYALFFLNPRAPYEKRWRGRLVETSLPWWRRWGRGR